MRRGGSLMVKTLTFIKRKEGTTHDECVKYHRDVHAPLVASAWSPEQLKRYAAYYLNEVVMGRTVEGAVTELPFDVVVEMWWEDEAWKYFIGEFQATPEGRKIAGDNRGFLDLEDFVLFVVEDNVIV